MAGAFLEVPSVGWGVGEDANPQPAAGIHLSVGKVLNAERGGRRGSHPKSRRRRSHHRGVGGPDQQPAGSQSAPFFPVEPSPHVPLRVCFLVYQLRQKSILCRHQLFGQCALDSGNAPLGAGRPVGSDRHAHGVLHPSLPSHARQCARLPTSTSTVSLKIPILKTFLKIARFFSENMIRFLKTSF